MQVFIVKVKIKPHKGVCSAGMLKIELYSNKIDLAVCRELADKIHIFIY